MYAAHMGSKKFVGAVIAEDEIDEIVVFETRKEYDAFASGVSRGASLYGAGSCGVYSLEELEEELNDLSEYGIAAETIRDAMNQIKEQQ